MPIAPFRFDFWFRRIQASRRPRCGEEWSDANSTPRFRRRRAAPQEDLDRDPHRLVDLVAPCGARHPGQPAQLVFADQHVEKQDGEPIRIFLDDASVFLLLGDPRRHDAVGGSRPGLVKKPAGLGERPADRNHEPVEFENRRRQHHRQERVTDLGQLRFQAAGRVDMDRHDDIPAFLPDHGLEQALLAAEPGIDRRLRAADHADDLVDRDVVVSLLQEQRRGQANDALAALFGGLGRPGPRAIPRGRLRADRLES